ncbi:hypothetical protein DSCA_36100 [Desulfosarcina alkanivorans]|uniref:Uncharacterized protein n=1 Tax=Desulfosarcina alkanivorans TaxID=571177 RepID=A0A5K7YN35_9BACT|nr:hypothetical protein DSCA_36100 [Desulfosarcina alkanivorans]
MTSERHDKAHMHRAFCAGTIDQGEVIYQVQGKPCPDLSGNASFLQSHRIGHKTPIVLQTAGGLMIIAGAGLAPAHRSN